MERFFVFRAWAGDLAADYATILPPELVSASGLAGDAIVGTLPPTDGEASLSPEGFVPNDSFSRVLQQVIADHATGSAGIRAEAQRVGHGWVYVIDRRTPTPEGPVPPEDILGGFQVSNGTAVPGTYAPNPEHRLLTERGFFHLDDDLHARLVAELRSRC